MGKRRGASTVAINVITMITIIIKLCPQLNRVKSWGASALDGLWPLAIIYSHADVSVNIFRLAKHVQERRVALQGIGTRQRPEDCIYQRKNHNKLTSIISKHVRVRPSRKEKGTLVLKEETVMSIINKAIMNVIDLARFPFNVEPLLLP